MTQTNELIELFIHGNQLKRTPRTGWLQRGVSQPETVAAHTCGVAFIALVLSELVEAPIDRGRLLAMAILHDLPEGLTSDIPAPAWRRLPAGAKYGVERQAMLDILGQTGVRAPLMAFWEGLDDGSLEAAIMHDADKLDLYLQAFLYEQQTGNRWLEEFWHDDYQFHLDAAQAVYDELAARRASANQGEGL
jgi:putative hydrolase of HD superfamily